MFGADLIALLVGVQYIVAAKFAIRALDVQIEAMKRLQSRRGVND